MAKPTRKVIPELTLLLALASTTIALLFVLYGPDEGFSTLLFVLPLVVLCAYLGELSQRKNRKK
jgi:hypothetical protein